MPRNPSTALRSARDDERTPAEILKKIRALEIKTKGLVQSAFAGDYHSVFKGRGMNFEDVREYQPGDEIRAIDWNVTARLGNAFVKKFTEERELTVMLVVDVSASGNFGSATVIEARARGRSRLPPRFQRDPKQRQGRTGPLFAIRSSFSSRRRKAARTRCVLSAKFFTSSRQGRGTLPSLALDYLNNVVTRRSVVFFISDFQAEDFSRALTVTSRRHDFIAIRIDDEREESLPDVGIITLEDAETGEQIEINTGDRRTRTRFSEAARAQLAETIHTLRRNNIDTISLRTGDDYLPALRAFFKQRERRMARR